MKEIEERQTHIRQLRIAFKNIKEIIEEETDLHRLIDIVCKNLTGISGYYNAWLLLTDKNGELINSHEICQIPAKMECPYCLKTPIDGNKIVILDNSKKNCLLSESPASVALACNLTSGGKIYGILIVSMASHYANDEEDLWIFELIAKDLAFKLKKIKDDEVRLFQEWEIKESLLESEERFRAISEYSHNAICIVDERTKITWFNNRMIEVCGYTKEQILGVNSFLDFIAPESVEFIVNNYQKFVSGKEYEHHYSFYAFRADGEKRLFEKHMTDYEDRHGKKNLIISMLDITERKRTEEEKEKLQKQLLQAQKMESVGRLAGGVAHDFNNILSVILCNAELAIDKTGPENKVYGHLREIEKSAHRSADLTRQLLAFARKQTVSPIVLDINETVKGMLKMLRRLIGEDVDLQWIPGNSLWHVKIDPVQLDQVLANLCINARDAIAGVGKIIISTENITMDTSQCDNNMVPGNYVLLSVSDDGCGMGKEVLGKIFEPFFTTKEIGKGTGLGLATVYGIVRQNNGFINVYSETGLGTIFRIYLPEHKGKSTGTHNEYQIEAIKYGNETILLVEDEPDLLSVVKFMLENLGYHVLDANSPGEAIELAKEYVGEIHLLITDVVMPEMNGRSLAEYLISIYKNMKCLFMSGYTADVIAHHGILEKGIQFIQKPFSNKELASKVREVLDCK